MDADDRFRHLQKKAPLLGRLFGGFFGFRVSGLGFIGAQHFRHFRPLAGVPFFLVCMEVTILFSNSGKKGMPFLYGDFHLEGSFGFLFRLL